jgi:hypothetical protein
MSQRELPFWWPDRHWPVEPAPPVQRPPTPGAFPARPAAMAEVPRGALFAGRRAKRDGWSAEFVISRGWALTAAGKDTGSAATAVSLRAGRGADRVVAVWTCRDDGKWFADQAYRWRIGCCMPTRYPLAGLTAEGCSHDHAGPDDARGGDDRPVVRPTHDPLAGVPVGVWLASRRPIRGRTRIESPAVETVTWQHVEPDDVIEAGGRGWRVVACAPPSATVVSLSGPPDERTTNALRPTGMVRRSLASRWDGPAIATLRASFPLSERG